MTIQSISKTKQTASKTIYAAFKILHENGGKMKRKDVIEKIHDTVEFTEWETHPYENGPLRWETILNLFLIDCVKAGFFNRYRGDWSLSKDGEVAILLGGEGIVDTANAAYKKWKNNKKLNNKKQTV
jgi:restriction system protein